MCGCLGVAPLTTTPSSPFPIPSQATGSLFFAYWLPLFVVFTIFAALVTLCTGVGVMLLWAMGSGDGQEEDGWDSSTQRLDSRLTVPDHVRDGDDDDDGSKEGLMSGGDLEL